MKKLLFMLLAFTTITLNAQKTVISKVTDTIDSVKQNTVNTVNFVDTSSTFKTIYTDIKSGLTGLAEGLKVGAEHVYIILIKQQVVNSITNIIIYIIISIFSFFWIRGYVKYKWDDLEDFMVSYSIFGGIIFVISLVYIFLSLTSTVTGFINPEYGAIMDIINFVKH